MVTNNYLHCTALFVYLQHKRSHEEIETITPHLLKIIQGDLFNLSRLHEENVMI